MHENVQLALAHVQYHPPADVFEYSFCLSLHSVFPAFLCMNWLQKINMYAMQFL